MTNDLKQVLEPEALGSTGVLYTRIREELGLGVTPILFTALGTYPKFLELSWNQLSPALRTKALLDGVQAVRERAALLIQQNFPPHPSLAQRIADPVMADDFLNSATFYLPILQTIAAAAIRWGTSGDHPTQAAELPKFPSLTIRRDPEELLPDSLRTLYERIRKELNVAFTPHGYRAIEHWPTLLLVGWDGFEAIVRTPAFANAQADLTAEFRRQGSLLPARIAPLQVTMEQAGLSEKERRELDDSLRFFETLSPKIVLNFTYYYLLLVEKEKLAKASEKV